MTSMGVKQGSRKAPVSRRRVRRLVGLTIALALISVASRSAASTPRCGSAKSQARDLESAITQYEREHGPLAEAGWRQALTEYVAPTTFIDPWGKPFVYRQHPHAYELFTLGPDGEEGTSDDQVRANGWAWRTCPHEGLLSCGF